MAAGWVMDRALITGFPKLLARRMALRLHAGGAQVSLLVEESDAGAAREFARGAMDVLVGDPSAMHLGLSTSEYRELTGGVTDVLHAAEQSTLASTREEMRRGEPTRPPAELELALDGRTPRRVAHPSTV